MFMNEFSMIHILSENKSAASSSLTKTCQVIHGNDLSVSVTSKGRGSQSKKIKAQKSFGFDEDDKDGEERPCCPLPTCWEHLSINTTCDLCHDNTFKLALLSYALVTVKFEVYLQQNLIVETLDKINMICERLITENIHRGQQVKALPVCSFHDNLELKDIYVECLSLIAETSLLTGNADQCARVVETAQKFFQTQCVSDLVANLIQNKFMVFKAQMCLMKSLTSKRDSMEEEIGGSETLLETSIQPEEFLPEVSSREEDQPIIEEVQPILEEIQPIIEEDQPIIEEDYQNLTEDLQSLSINDVTDQNKNKTKTGTRAKRGRGTALKQQSRGNSEKVSKSSRTGTEDPELASEEKEKQDARVQGRGRS